MLSKLIFALILMLAMQAFLDAKSRYNLELHFVRCKCLTNITKTFECSIKKLGANRFSFSGLCELRRPLHPNTEVSICTHYKLPKMNRMVKFIDIRINICDIMSSMQRMPLVRDVLIEIRRSSNFPLTCPIKENIMYNLSNMIITNDLIPPYAPHLHFNTSVLFYEHQLQIAYYNLSGSVIPKSVKG